MPQDTYRLQVEYTDTFAGQANYAWVLRAFLDIPHGTSGRAVMRRAKAAIGLSGVRGRSSGLGETYEFRPYRMATILFVTPAY